MQTPFNMIDIQCSDLNEIPHELIDEWIEYLESVNCGLEELKKSDLVFKVHTIITCKRHPLLLSSLALDFSNKGLNKILRDIHSLAYTHHEFRGYLSWLRYFIYKASYHYEGYHKLILDWKDNDLEPFLRPPHNTKEWRRFTLAHSDILINKTNAEWIPDKKLSEKDIYEEYIKNAKVRSNIPTEDLNLSNEENEKVTELLQPSLIDGLATAVKAKPKTQQKPSKPKAKPADNSPSLFSF